LRGRCPFLSRPGLAPCVSITRTGHQILLMCHGRACVGHPGLAVAIRKVVGSGSDRLCFGQRFSRRGRRARREVFLGLWPFGPAGETKRSPECRRTATAGPVRVEVLSCALCALCVKCGCGFGLRRRRFSTRVQAPDHRRFSLLAGSREMCECHRAWLGPTHLQGWIKRKSWVTGASPVMTQGGNTAVPDVQDRTNLVRLLLGVASARQRSNPGVDVWARKLPRRSAPCGHPGAHLRDSGRDGRC
jgi:hypothetical protein